MVIIGERGEEGLKNGKIASASNNQTGAKKPFNNSYKKKEGETNAVVIGSSQASSAQMPHYQYPYVAAIAQGQYPQPVYQAQQQSRMPPQNQQQQNGYP
jgi:hypothetical protein